MPLARHPRVRRWHAVVAGVLLLVAAGGGAVLLGEPSGGDTADADVEDVPTAPVRRGDLRQAQDVPGTLGFGSPTTVAGSGEGIITWLPSAGVTVTRGQQLFRVDDAPVSVFYGGLPLYRTLSDHALDTDAGETEDGDRKGGKAPTYPVPTGNDVDLVAQNLASLGYYYGPTVEARYDWTLAHAVAEWQESQGVEETGVLDPAAVVVTADAVRVDDVTAQVGGAAAQEILTVTGTAEVITLRAPVEVAKGLRPGLHIGVTLPDGRRVRTRIERIGTSTADGEDGGPPSVPVTVAPLRRKALPQATLGPVSARIVTAARRDVLTVPLTALLSLSGGGYAVQRPDGALVPVTLGMVAQGRVEVTGVEAGATVVVAR